MFDKTLCWVVLEEFGMYYLTSSCVFERFWMGSLFESNSEYFAMVLDSFDVFGWFPLAKCSQMWLPKAQRNEVCNTRIIQ